MTTVEQDETEARISRRTALKAAAAAGVGAAAFAGPQIGVLGSSPAYGQAGVCSKPISTLTTTLGSLNNGAGQCGGFARINQAYRPGDVTQNGIRAQWNEEGCLGSSDVTITSALNWCTVTVTVAGSGNSVSSTGPFAAGGTVAVPFPTVLDGEIPNGNANLVVNCSDDIDCV